MTQDAGDRVERTVFTDDCSVHGKSDFDREKHLAGRRQRCSRGSTGRNQESGYHLENAGMLDAENKDELAQRKGNMQAKYTGKGMFDEG